MSRYYYLQKKNSCFFTIIAFHVRIYLNYVSDCSSHSSFSYQGKMWECLIVNAPQKCHFFHLTLHDNHLPAQQKEWNNIPPSDCNTFTIFSSSLPNTSLNWFAHAICESVNSTSQVRCSKSAERQKVKQYSPLHARVQLNTCAPISLWIHMCFLPHSLSCFLQHV